MTQAHVSQKAIYLAKQTMLNTLTDTNLEKLRFFSRTAASHALYRQPDDIHSAFA